MVSELVPHLARGFAIRRALKPQGAGAPRLFLPPSAPRRAEIQGADFGAAV